MNVLLWRQIGQSRPGRQSRFWAIGMGITNFSITYETDVRDRPLSAISVRAAAGDPRRGWLTADGWTVPVALGRGGILANKREGDGGTPHRRPWQRRVPASGAHQFFSDGGMRLDDEIRHAAAVAANEPANENHP